MMVACGFNVAPRQFIKIHHSFNITDYPKYSARIPRTSQAFRLSLRCSALLNGRLVGSDVLLTFYKSELLYPPAPVGLGNIDVAFGIHRQCVTVSEITELVAGTAERGQDLSGSMIERV